MSSSRRSGCGDISFASRIRSSVVSPIADRTATTLFPASRAAAQRAATAFSFPVSATDEPPNFITTRPGERGACSTAGTASYSVAVTPAVYGRVSLHLAAPGERAAEGDLVRVLEVAADGEAAREPRDADPVAKPVGQVRRRRLPGHVRVRREDDLLDAVPVDAAQQLVDAQVLGLDAVERRQRAAEHVVEAAELARPLDGDHVHRLLDDADHRGVAPRVAADRAQLLLR